MAGKYLLAYDLGTGGLKAVLYSEQGIQIDTLFEEYPVSSQQETWAEQDPEAWWSGFCRTTRALIEKNAVSARDIAVLSFSGQMMACLPVDRRGYALRDCIIWADRRSTAQIQLLHERIDETDYYKITGNKIYPTYSLPKLMWIKDNEPGLYRETYKFLQPKDFLVCRLTGSFVTDYSDAAGTAALDMRKRIWADEILELAGVEREKLPQILSSTDRPGTVNRAAAEQSGLLEGTPVVIGAGDGPCGSLGAGVYREGNAYIYLGTSSWVSAASKELVADPDMVLFNICSVKPELIYVYGTMQMGGGSLQWLKNTVCAVERIVAELSGSSPYEYMNRQAEHSPAGAGNLIFLPYLRGERSPRWNPSARGAFVGLTASHSRADMIRAVMEGVAYNLKIIRDALRSQGTPIEEMRIIGGGAESQLWRRIFADIFQETLWVPELREAATTLGAAVIGGVGIGLFEDFDVIEKLNPVKFSEKPTTDSKILDRYEDMYRQFNKIYDLLCPVFDEMQFSSRGQG
jgi:xylulokinase